MISVHSPRRARAAVVGVTVATAVAAVTVVSASASVAASTSVAAARSGAASASARPGAGVIHIVLVNTSLDTAAPTQVLITGAFSDHGTGKHGTWHLTRGTITVNASALKAVIASPSFGTFYTRSCSFSGSATGRTPIVGGTGAYAGIHGTLTVTETNAEEGSLRASGACNTSSSAPAVAEDLVVTGSGRVSF
jgi:hypothetical protein